MASLPVLRVATFVKWKVDAVRVRLFFETTGLRVRFPRRADVRLLKTVWQSVADLKARLLRASAGVNRGLSCREGEQEEILEIVEDLEVR